MVNKVIFVLVALLGVLFWFSFGGRAAVPMLGGAADAAEAAEASAEPAGDAAPSASSRSARRAPRSRAEQNASAPEPIELDPSPDAALLSDLDGRTSASLAVPADPDGFPHDRPVSEQALSSSAPGGHSLPVLRNREEARRVIERHHPPQLKAIGIGGTVVLTLVIDETGRVREPRITNGSQNALLNAAALRAAAELQFTPARRFGRNVKAERTFTVVFRP